MAAQIGARSRFRFIDDFFNIRPNSLKLAEDIVATAIGD